MVGGCRICQCLAETAAAATRTACDAARNYRNAPRISRARRNGITAAVCRRYANGVEAANRSVDCLDKWLRINRNGNRKWRSYANRADAA